MDTNKVLVLGNGLSRLQYRDYINTWDGEIWGCNSAYLEVADGSIPHMERLMGDYVALKVAVKYKRKYKLKYVMYGKHKRSWDLPGVQKLSLPTQFYGDSGSILVAAALYEGYNEVKALGFDLGGKDMYVQHHDRKDKSKWVRNWRRIAKNLPFDKLEFIGYDHKPFILSNKPDDFYAKYYLNGEDHLQVSLSH